MMFTNPELEVVIFANEDVITASGSDQLPDDEF